MSVYTLTPLAKSDIFQIWSYIADDARKTFALKLNLC